ncbi:MAG TPA: 50S ribosomal protein L4, partial [Ruminococcaceae bacterium]|nr:50S ribosomal protein L4 [Oscillospiraceae bacterium]HCB91019.1 50S ribosomal protein L4 [Oscillospiraceae bacterium]
MPTIAVLDKTGKEVGKLQLSDAVFGIEPNRAVLHSAVVAHLAA